MRPEGSPAELERRRLRAMALVQQGYSLHAVARRLHCHASSVMRWHDAFARGGQRALRPKSPRKATRQGELGLYAQLHRKNIQQVAEGGDSTRRAALVHPPDTTTSFFALTIALFMQIPITTVYPPRRGLHGFHG